MDPFKNFGPAFKFYKEPAEDALFWTCVLVLVVGVGGFLLHRLFIWLHARREQKRFFARAAFRGVGGESEDALVDLVNHNLDILGRPTEIFRSLRVFDSAASAEIERLLAADLSNQAKQEQMDRIYLLRRQMFPARGVSVSVGESGGEAA